MVAIGLRYKLNINKQIQCNLINGWVHEDKIVNHSKNIIDLIQEGDIVEIIDVLNQEIIYIWDDEMLKAVREDIENGLKIGRILTKEQYEQNCYKVVE